MATDEIQQAHAAKSQSLFREVNERIQEVADQDAVELLCECTDTSCTETVTLTRAEYDAVRANPHRFPVKHGHDEEREIEHIVAEHDGYVVVEKIEVAARVAEKLDPARRTRKTD